MAAAFAYQSSNCCQDNKPLLVIKSVGEQTCRPTLRSVPIDS